MEIFDCYLLKKTVGMIQREKYQKFVKLNLSLCQEEKNWSSNDMLYTDDFLHSHAHQNASETHLSSVMK